MGCIISIIPEMRRLKEAGECKFETAQDHEIMPWASMHYIVKLIKKKEDI